MKFNINYVDDTTPLVPYRNFSEVPCIIKLTPNKTQQILTKNE